MLVLGWTIGNQRKGLNLLGHGLERGRAITLRPPQSGVQWSEGVHLGGAGNWQLQLGLRVAIGSPEQSLDSGKDGAYVRETEVRQMEKES